MIEMSVKKRTTTTLTTSYTTIF